MYLLVDSPITQDYYESKFWEEPDFSMRRKIQFLNWFTDITFGDQSCGLAKTGFHASKRRSLLSEFELCELWTMATLHIWRVATRDKRDLQWSSYFCSYGLRVGGRASASCTAKNQCRKLETNIPRKGIARPLSHFPHACVCEWFIYSLNLSAYSAAGNMWTHPGNI